MEKNLCDKKLFKKVFDAYAKELKRFLYFKFRDLTSAEDVLQESFLKLWKNCDKVSYDKVKSYLFTVANNSFLDIKKHEKVVRNHHKKVIREENIQSPEYLMIEKEFLEKVEKAIAELPEKQREVFVMSKIEKMKYKEIAEKLGISVKAVEKRMRNALMNFKEKIDIYK